MVFYTECRRETFRRKTTRKHKKFFDQDGSGAIDTKELGNIMRQLGAKLTDSEINLLVQEADVDGDGQVDINEVCIVPNLRIFGFRMICTSPYAGGPGRA